MPPGPDARKGVHMSLVSHGCCNLAGVLTKPQMRDILEEKSRRSQIPEDEIKKLQTEAEQLR
jgi:hypothetical protein